MKKSRSSTMLKVLSLIFVIMLSVFCLFSCISQEQNEYAKEKTEMLVNLLIDDNYSGAYYVFRKYISKQDFNAGYEEIVGFFEDIEKYSYELKPVGWEVATNDEITTYTVTFDLSVDGVSKMMISSTFWQDNNDMLSFNIVPADMMSQKEATPYNIGFILFSLISIAFVVLMLIDCIKHNIKNKILWIIIIIVSIAFTVTIAQENFKFNFMLSILPVTFMIATGYQVSVTVSLPLGALIYLIMRKKLAITPPPPPTDNVAVSFGDNCSCNQTNKQTDQTTTEENNIQTIDIPESAEQNSVNPDENITQNNQ